MIGAVGAGLFKDLAEASEHMVHVKDTYEPSASAVSQYNEVFKVWQSCYNGLATEAFPNIKNYQEKY